MIAAALAAAAMAHGTTVGIGYSAFLPPQVTVLAGDTVSWHNGSLREHTVTGPDFASGALPAHLGGFSHTFTAPGAVKYVCTIHPGMSGEVDVESLLLDRPAPALRGRPLVLSGRAEAGVDRVRLERDLGAGFREVAQAPVDGDGMFRAVVPAASSAAYRAVADGERVSPAVRVVVRGQQVRAAAILGRRGSRQLRGATLPPRPGGTVVLQLRLRERFGWWPVARRRLDRRGRASFTLASGGRVRARVVLSERDGVTALTTSRVLRLPARG
jgi:plastocyanin